MQHSTARSHSHHLSSSPFKLLNFTINTNQPGPNAAALPIFQYHYHTLLPLVFLLLSLFFSQDHTSRVSMAKDDEFYGYYASSTSSSSSLIRSISQKTSTTNFKSPLLRTFSHKNSSSSYNGPLPPLPPLSRDCLQKSFSSSSSSSSRQRVSSRTSSSSSSMKCSEIAHKCTRLVKEQRARFYIMKRCVKMLICWGKHDRS